MMMTKYSANVDKLLNYGAFDFKEIPNYLELGFTEDDIPALLQLLEDENLFDNKEDPIASAPYHAYYVLGQLKAEQAILPLLNKLKELEFDDWLSEDIPDVLALIGGKAILPMQAYLFDENIDEDAKLGIVGTFSKIAKNEPEFKAQCQEILVSCLTQITTQDSALAGFVISALLDLDAKEEIEVIQEAFKHGYVDLSVVGDIEDVEIEFGLRKQRSTPRPIPPQIKKLRELFKQNFNVDFNEEPVSKTEQVIKVGRNDPCPCGSGKKYKKCCLQ